MPDFKDYPKHMNHPAFDPGEIGEQVRSPAGFTYYRGGKPTRFPPVLVHNADDEEYYAAKGYVSDGKSDPAAFQRATAIAPSVVNKALEEYPKWVGDRIVKSAEEEAALSGKPVKPQPIGRAAHGRHGA